MRTTIGLDTRLPFELVTSGQLGGYAPTPAEMATVLEEDDFRTAPRQRDVDEETPR